MSMSWPGVWAMLTPTLEPSASGLRTSGGWRVMVSSTPTTCEGGVVMPSCWMTFLVAALSMAMRAACSPVPT